MRKKVWINQGDIILLSLRDYQDEKGDVILKYNADEARSLKAYGELPESAKINVSRKFVRLQTNKHADCPRKPIPMDKREPTTATSSSTRIVQTLTATTMHLLARKRLKLTTFKRRSYLKWQTRLSYQTVFSLIVLPPNSASASIGCKIATELNPLDRRTWCKRRLENTEFCLWEERSPSLVLVLKS